MAADKFNCYLVEEIDMYNPTKFQIDLIRIESTRFFSISKNCCACARGPIFISNFFCLSWTDINDISKNQNDIHPGKQKSAYCASLGTSSKSDSKRRHGGRNKFGHARCVRYTTHKPPLDKVMCARKELRCVLYRVNATLGCVRGRRRRPRGKGFISSRIMGCEAKPSQR